MLHKNFELLSAGPRRPLKPGQVAAGVRPEDVAIVDAVARTLCLSSQMANRFVDDAFVRELLKVSRWLCHWTH